MNEFINKVYSKMRLNEFSKLLIYIFCGIYVFLSFVSYIGTWINSFSAISFLNFILELIIIGLIVLGLVFKSNNVFKTGFFIFFISLLCNCFVNLGNGQYIDTYLSPYIKDTFWPYAIMLIFEIFSCLCLVGAGVLFILSNFFDFKKLSFIGALCCVAGACFLFIIFVFSIVYVVLLGLDTSITDGAANNWPIIISSLRDFVAALLASLLLLHSYKPEQYIDAKVK